MKPAAFITFSASLIISVACGGSSPHSQVPEVPIDQGNGKSSDLPPDEVGDAGATSTVVLSDATAPPGVGPQSLDVTQDAGTQAAAPAAFVQRPGGLTQRECTDVIMTFAKLTTKEGHGTTPAATDIPAHPIYGQMLIECGNTTTKKQQRCAVASKSTGSWKKCME